MTTKKTLLQTIRKELKTISGKPGCYEFKQGRTLVASIERIGNGYYYQSATSEKRTTTLKAALQTLTKDLNIK